MNIYEKICESIEESTGGTCNISKLDFDKAFFFFETWTAVGEDVVIEIDFEDNDTEDLLSQLRDYTEYFDVDDYAEPFIEQRGQNGIPSSIRAILDSAEEVGDIYQKVYDAAREVVS